MLLTNEMCTPSRLWLPEHSRQQKAPMGKELGGAPGGGTMRDAQSGFAAGQSLQTWFSGLCMRALSRFFLCFHSSSDTGLCENGAWRGDDRTY